MKTTIELEKWLIKCLGHEVYDPTLLRVQAAIDVLGLSPSSKIISVAGTNGKGSVTRLIARSLQTKFNVLQFTSPHLYSLTERFVYNGVEISEEKLFQLVQSLWQSMQRYQLTLTYFEFLFVVFLLWAKEIDVDFCVLEVGLGGRLDAVNSLDAHIAIITSIGRDHQEYLGSRYQDILKEKLGIARTGRVLITALELNFLTQIVSFFCEEHKIQFLNIDGKQDFTYVNEQIVKHALEFLDLNLEVNHEANPVATTHFCHPHFIIDQDFEFYGAHNPAAVRKLVQFLLQEHYNNEKVYDLLILSFSRRDEKDLIHMLKLFKMLCPQVAREIILTSFEHFKAEHEEVIKKIAALNGIKFVKDYSHKISTSKTIMASGSNYFYRSVVHALPRVCKSESESSATVGRVRKHLFREGLPKK